MPGLFQNARQSYPGYFPSMTFGKKLWDSLVIKSQHLGRKCTEIEFITIADAMAQSEGIMRKNKPKGSMRARNPLFDALALSTGTRNLNELSRTAAKQIAVALADITSVCPDITIDEIERRVGAYKKRWPEARNLSAPALAKHWAQFGTGDKTKAARMDVYQEPGEWLSAAIELFGFETATQLKDKGWFKFGVDWRAQILASLARRDSLKSV